MSFPLPILWPVFTGYIFKKLRTRFPPFPRFVTADVVFSAIEILLKLIDCSALCSISITEISSLQWALLTSHSSLLPG